MSELSHVWPVADDHIWKSMDGNLKVAHRAEKEKQTSINDKKREHLIKASPETCPVCLEWQWF